MREGRSSSTAQRVAAYRLGFDRVPAPFGDPAADERLALDVAGAAAFEPNEWMARYLRARTSFFDRVVVNALNRNVSQVVAIGAGYDGRALRYYKPGVRWFEVDHPDTQADKRHRLERLGIGAPQILFVGVDLSHAGLASALVQAGYEPDAPSVIMCEGVVVYLDEAVVETLLAELRALATIGTRLALSLSVPMTSTAQSARRQDFQAAVRAMGEPARNTLTADDAGALLAASRWRAIDVSERAARAGFVIAAPSWVLDSGQPTASRVGTFMEQMFDRSGTDSLANHLESTYHIGVAGQRQLDLGVFRVDRTDGVSWVARVFPRSRPVDAAIGDAGILQALEHAGFPAERCAHDEPVSIHQGQAVLVTEYVGGKAPRASAATYRTLGDLLGRLHSLPAGVVAPTRPGGAWHHLALQGDLREEIASASSLLDAAGPRVPATERALYQVLCDELARADDCSDLPYAVIHPDFVPPNIIASANGDLVVIDWTGAGHGPRVPSLGFLLWAAGSQDLTYVDAVVSGYRSRVQLEPEELDRLEAVVAARPLIFGCWAFSTGRERLPDVVDQLSHSRAGAAAIAARAGVAFHDNSG